MSHRTNTLRIARGNTARPFTGTALDVTLRACDRDVPELVYLLAPMKHCLPDGKMASLNIMASLVAASLCDYLVHGTPSASARATECSHTAYRRDALRAC